MKPDPTKRPLIHRWAAIALTALILGFSIYSASGLMLEEDVLALLPADPEISRYRKMLKQFNPMNAMLLEVQRRPGDEEALWLDRIDSLVLRMEESGQFKKVLHRFSPGAWAEALNFLKRYRPLLYSPSDRAEIAAKTAYDSILASFQAFKKTLMESPAPFVISQFMSDPLGIDAPLLKKLQALSGGNGSITVHQGRLMSPEHAHALIIAYPHVKATDSRGAAALVDFMDTTIAGFTSLDIAYVSGHRFSLENSRRIQADIKLTLSIALGAIILLAFLIFSRPWLVFLTILPALAGTAMALGLMRWITPSLSAIAVGSGGLLIGITVDYSIHLLFHIESDGSDISSALTHRNKLRKPLLLSAATTGAAFGALCLSTLPGYRQLGGFAAAGIAGSLICVLYLLPHMIISRKNSLRSPRLALPSLFPRFFSWAAGHRRILLALLIVITVLMIPGLFYRRKS